MADEGIETIELQTEPACWRRHLGPDGIAQILKPDLAVSLLTKGRYRDSWFIELDLATENPARVVSKCAQYDTYRRSGAEQRTHDLFPAVIWVTPTEARAQQLRRHIAAVKTLPQRLFTVVTLEDFAKQIRQGPPGE